MSGPILITGGGSVGRSLWPAAGLMGIPCVSLTCRCAILPGWRVSLALRLCGRHHADGHCHAGGAGVSAVMHLAAILPPASERNRERTLAINVDGTMHIIRAMEANAREAVLVFSSSVSTYGDTTSETPPVRVNIPKPPWIFTPRARSPVSG